MRNGTTNGRKNRSSRRETCLSLDARAEFCFFLSRLPMLRDTRYVLRNGPSRSDSDRFRGAYFARRRLLASESTLRFSAPVHALVDRSTIYLPNCARKKERAYGVATRSHSAGLDRVYQRDPRATSFSRDGGPHFFSYFFPALVGVSSERWSLSLSLSLSHSDNALSSDGTDG